MGLFKKLLGLGDSPAIENGVRGTAQVVACSGHSAGSVYQMCNMQLVVQADGVPATAVAFSGLVHRDRWPESGMTLPVTIDPANPQNVRIEWDEVQSSNERAQASAEAIAAAMRGEGSAAPPVVNLSGQDLSSLPEEKKARLRMFGVDPDAPARGASGQPPVSEDDVEKSLERLEGLGELVAQGTLPLAEFAARKREILG